MRKKLTKSRSNVVVSGVLGGIGEYIGIDPTVLRVIFIVLTIFGAGTPAFLYFILMLIMPSNKGNSYGNPYNKGQQSNQSYQNYNNGPKGNRKRKEAEKVEDEDWSDF